MDDRRCKTKRAQDTETQNAFGFAVVLSAFEAVFWAKFYEAETPAKDPCNLQAYKEQQKCYKTQLEKCLQTSSLKSSAAVRSVVPNRGKSSRKTHLERCEINT